MSTAAVCPEDRAQPKLLKPSWKCSQTRSTCCQQALELTPSFARSKQDAWPCKDPYHHCMHHEVYVLEAGQASSLKRCRAATMSFDKLMACRAYPMSLLGHRCVQPAAWTMRPGWS